MMDLNYILLQIIFWLTALAVIGGALGVILARKTLHAALALLMLMLAIGTIYFLLELPVLAIFQLILYAGAVMVMVFYIIMLIGDDKDTVVKDKLWMRTLPVTIGIVALMFFCNTMLQLLPSAVAINPAMELGIKPVIYGLLGPYILPFETESLILLTALVGVVVIVRGFGNK